MNTTVHFFSSGKKGVAPLLAVDRIDVWYSVRSGEVSCVVPIFRTSLATAVMSMCKKSLQEW